MQNTHFIFLIVRFSIAKQIKQIKKKNFKEKSLKENEWNRLL